VAASAARQTPAARTQTRSLAAVTRIYKLLLVVRMASESPMIPQHDPAAIPAARRQPGGPGPGGPGPATQ
jgi:hypothetical protein